MFRSLLRSPWSSLQRTPISRKRSLSLESLESRELLAANLAATFRDGVLHIVGTPENDLISIRQDAGQVSIGNVAISTQTGASSAVSASSISRIEVQTSAGNDVIRLDEGSEAVTAPLTLVTSPKVLVFLQGSDLYGYRDGQAVRLATDVMRAYGLDDTRAPVDLSRVDPIEASQVTYLTKSGKLYTQDQAGLRELPLAGGTVADMAMDSQGRLIVRDQSNTLLRSKDANGEGGWEELGRDVIKFAPTKTGSWIVLQRDGQVCVDGMPKWSNKQDLFIDGQDRLILVEKGLTGISRSKEAYGNGGWVPLATNVSRYTVTANGVCIALQGDKSLMIDGTRFSGRAVLTMENGSVLANIQGELLLIRFDNTDCVVKVASGVQSFAGYGDDVFFLSGTSLRVRHANGTYDTWCDNAQGLYQGKDAGGKPAAFLRQDGTLFQFAGSSWARIAKADKVVEDRSGGVLFLDGSCLRVTNGQGGYGTWCNDAQGLFQGRDDAGRPLNYIWQGYTLFEFRESGWVKIGHADKVVEDRSGGVLFMDGNYLRVTNGAGGFSTWTNNAQGVIQARDPSVGLAQGVDAVRSYSRAGDGTLYSLKESGQLVAYSSTGGWLDIQIGAVRSFSLAGDGTLYALKESGQLVARAPSGAWYDIQIGAVRSFSLAGDGTLYALKESSELVARAPTGAWYDIQIGAVRSFSLAGDGTLYALKESGQLVTRTPTGSWYDIQIGAVRSFSLAGDGTLYALKESSQLVARTPTGAWYDIQIGAVRSFSLVGNGTLYALKESGQLVARTLTGTWHDVQQSDGNPVTYMMQDNTLFGYSASGWEKIGHADKVAVTAGGKIVFLDGTTLRIVFEGTFLKVCDDVRTFAVGTNGIIVLHTGGDLSNYFDGLNPERSAVIAFNVKTVANGPDGTVWALQTNGDLRRDGATGWYKVKEFTFTADGRLVVLWQNGVLGRTHQGLGGNFDTMGGDETCPDRAVVRWSFGPDGAVWALQANGDLRRDGATGWYKVKEFTFTADGRLLVLWHNGVLSRTRQGLGGPFDDMGGYETRPNSTVIRYGFGPDGALWALQADGDLRREGSLIQCGVRSFGFNTNGSLATESFAQIKDGVLYVTGTQGDDTIIVSPWGAGGLSVSYNGRNVLNVGSNTVRQVAVLVGGGNDYVDCSGINVPVYIDGAFIKGGSANQTFFGGESSDAITTDNVQYAMLSGNAGNDHITVGPDVIRAHLDLYKNRSKGNDCYTVLGDGVEETIPYTFGTGFTWRTTDGFRTIRRPNGGVISVLEDNHDKDQLEFGGYIDHLDDDGFWSDVGSFIENNLGSIITVAAGFVTGGIGWLGSALISNVAGQIYNIAALGQSFSLESLVGKVATSFVGGLFAKDFSLLDSEVIGSAVANASSVGAGAFASNVVAVAQGGSFSLGSVLTSTVSGAVGGAVGAGVHTGLSPLDAALKDMASSLAGQGVDVALAGGKIDWLKVLTSGAEGAAGKLAEAGADALTKLFEAKPQLQLLASRDDLWGRMDYELDTAMYDSLLKAPANPDISVTQTEGKANDIGPGWVIQKGIDGVAWVSDVVGLFQTGITPSSILLVSANKIAMVGGWADGNNTIQCLSASGGAVLGVINMAVAAGAMSNPATAGYGIYAFPIAVGSMLSSTWSAGQACQAWVQGTQK